ncbi:MAG: hypothetical protein CL908_10020 [Deltaproteobacteria bacterium]|nr:hypothetical protein [Deltaproteobacteria bacterium]
MPSVEQLKQHLAHTLRAKQLDAALGALSMLARKQPLDPNWPRRSARLLRARSDQRGELAALRRALELQVDQGRVLDAIASCKAILEIVPKDPRTLETLDLLYLNAPQPAPSRAPDEVAVLRESMDAPLDSMLLTEVVPDARSVQIADGEPGCITEIPVDVGGSSMQAEADDEVVDLCLDDWSSSQDLCDLAAAQAVVLPSVGQAVTGESGPRERGASLRSELANIPLFGDLDPASLHTLIHKVRVVVLDAGQVLFRQGDPANTLYVVVEGAVVPIAEGERRRKLAVLERGAFFGEIGLMAKQPRNATIEALVETKLLAIDRRVLWALIDKQPSVAKSILRFLRDRLIDRQIRTNLFFSAFAHAEREAVAKQFRILEVTDGTRIVEQGKPPEGLFVVLSGALAVIDREGGKERVELALGDVFGGLSLLEGQPASADVVARGKCWLVLLCESRFRRILDKNPRLVRVIRRLSSEGNKAGPGSGLPPVAAL